MQSSSQSCPIEIKDALDNPSSTFACCAALDYSLWIGAIPISVVLIVAPFGTPTLGPLLIFIGFCKISLSDGLM